MSSCRINTITISQEKIIFFKIKIRVMCNFDYKEATEKLTTLICETLIT